MGCLAQTLTTNKLLCTLLVIELSMSYMMVTGEVYKVGDSAGWNVNSNLDYASWAASKTFRVDDVLLFEYNATNENVIEVSHLDFRSCNTSTPIQVLNTGNDSFTIKLPGHYFFTSNLQEHCKAGQKIDVRVPKTPPPVATPQQSSTVSPSPSPSSSDAQAPSPMENAATTHDPKWMLTKAIGVTLSGLVVFGHGYA